MTQQRAVDLLPVIQAFAAGKTVQSRTHGNAQWSDVLDPTFHWQYEWRIKPESREYTIIYSQWAGGLLATQVSGLPLDHDQRVKVQEISK